MIANWCRRVLAQSSNPIRSRQAGPPRRTRLGLEPLEIRATPAIITVTGTDDTIAVDGLVTLREAITAANTNLVSGDAPAGSGTDTINFNIAGAPGTVHTIQPQSALPTITEAVIIDGYSQLGASPNSLVIGDNAFLAIELDGTNAGFNAGLTISAGNSTVQGLIINRFGNEGILVLGTGGNTIRGNFVGTDQTGNLDQGNGIVGVGLLSSNNTVGGTAPADRNIISGNNFGGVAVATAGVTGNKIQGNLIGTDDTGVAALGNQGDGVRIQNVQGTTVGGTQAGAGNVIAFNAGVGIRVDSNAGSGNAFLGNSIHSNGGLGIDLNNDGPTANDPSDADSGPNGLQNTPVLASATRGAAGGVIAGTLTAAPSATFRIELFANTAADPSGFGEGKIFLGFVNATTDATGNASFAFKTAAIAVGTSISATATNSANSTSESCQNLSTLPSPGTGKLVAGTLNVSGTSRNDVIIIEPRPGSSTQIRATVNGTPVAILNRVNVKRVAAHGLAGNDTIIVNTSLNVPAELHGNGGNDQLHGGRVGDRLYGEVGNDSLYGRTGYDLLDGGAGFDRLDGGAGHDVVVGGADSDVLLGSIGRDILIGGLGNDFLDGGVDDDILIGGTTDHDADAAALLLLISEWNAPASASTRIANLAAGGGLNGSSVLNPGGTVQADGAFDRVVSGIGFDWILRSTADTDLLLDLTAGKDRVDNI